MLKTPVPLDVHPPELQSLLGYEFFKEDPATGKMRELNEIFGPDAEKEFWLQLDDLATRRLPTSSKLARPPGRQTSRPRGSVYPRRDHRGAEEEREAMKRDLVQHGYTVLPTHPLPLSAHELEAAVREDLERCRLSIHMVGRTYSLVPEGALNSVVELQNELAIERAAAGSFHAVDMVSSRTEVRTTIASAPSYSGSGWIRGSQRTPTCSRRRSRICTR